MPCVTGKRCYKRRRDAQRALRRLQSLPHNTVRLSHSYKCWVCGNHHLSSKPYLKGAR